MMCHLKVTGVVPALGFSFRYTTMSLLTVIFGGISRWSFTGDPSGDGLEGLVSCFFKSYKVGE